ncbi:MAG TPA: RhuM family protein [Saprospiraceae bacterium]|nr:RhuM family protein [Saprospiraceae bacterium]
MENKNSEFIIFKTEDEKISVDVRMNDETVWLTQDQLAVLFGVERPGITQHIKNIFTEGELQEASVGKKFLRTAADGKKYDTKHYNLDMIISLGYRVNSKIATQFRIWATKRLNEYIRKGFTMDDERLKNIGGGGYWKELLQRIRDIRASEKVFYRQVLDIYSRKLDIN